MIEEKYTQLCNTPSDIYQHLPTLKRYAEQSESIVELGVRGIVSTWALLSGKPKHMISVDIETPNTYGGDIWEVYDACNAEQIDFEFVQKSSLEIDLPPHDFLFIDTLHNYDQLTAELEKHSGSTQKFIAMHDTHIPDLPEMMQAVQDFLAKHSEWEIAEDRVTNNGMTFLKRV